MARVTINKVNDRIFKYGFELVRGNGYYYFSRTREESPTITEDGIYGTPYLNAWTIDELEITLLERIKECDNYPNSNHGFAINAQCGIARLLDNK